MEKPFASSGGVWCACDRGKGEGTRSPPTSTSPLSVPRSQSSSSGRFLSCTEAERGLPLTPWGCFTDTGRLRTLEI